jgi:Alpha/beta hydrolase domain
MVKRQAIDPGLGGGPWNSVADTLPEGATEQEWILEGKASRYRLIGEYRPDGQWSAEAAETAPFRTRILVERPAADRFNGFVVVVWNNVSAGFDGMFAGSPTAVMLHDGYAVVGVSAQSLGVHGERGLISSAAERYSTLSHPGDDYSYDIFAQAVRAASGRDGTDAILGDLSVHHVVASGASQSAGRLATMHNAFHQPGLIDAYHLPVYFGNGTVVDATGGEAVVPGGSTNWTMRMLRSGTHGLREDLGVPVFILNSESEAQVFTTNQQADSDHLIIFENAGASHIGSTAGDNRFGLPENRCRGSFAAAQRAVWYHLRRWLEDDIVPPSQPRLEKAADGWLARDEHGNALGGIRWPHVVVPLGTHRAEPPTEGIPDRMGSTTPFDPEKVRRLYGTYEQYEARFADAVSHLVATGVVLAEDADSVRDPLAASLLEGGSHEIPRLP